VTPKIYPDGKVLMRVRPEISSVGVGQISIGGGAVAVPFNVQTVETTIMAQDGETVVVGGLISHRDNKTENKIPWLGDLPGVGALFRFRSQVKNKSELIAILTPRIIYSRHDTESILAEEARKMDWLWGDVMRLYDVPGMQAVAPPPKDPRNGNGNGDCPPDKGADMLHMPAPHMPAPSLGDPVIGEPLHAPQQSPMHTPQQSPTPPAPRPQPDNRPRPMPDGPAANIWNNSRRYQATPTSMNSTSPSPVGVYPRPAQPMPNGQ
jgi:hypothetical protein